MVEREAATEVGVRLLLKSDDQALRDIGELDRSELELLRATIESTLARLTLADRVPTVSLPLDHLGDAGFSCEWWPPD
jgi:hypothetical protein